MGSKIDIVVFVLFTLWAIGYFALSATGWIHILLIIAVISMLISIIQGRRLL